MIRPRAGDFLYSNEELEVMLEDIGLFKSISVTGVVFGVLNPDGTVDVPRTRMYVVGLHSPYTVLHGAIDSWGLLFPCKVARFPKYHTNQHLELSQSVFIEPLI
jgi:hypothetical protein